MHDLRLTDQSRALVLTVAALVDAGAPSRHGLSALALVSSIVLTGSVAWSRKTPVLATIVAASALLELVGRGAGNGLFDELTIAWIFYVLALVFVMVVSAGLLAAARSSHPHLSRGAATG